MHSTARLLVMVLPLVMFVVGCSGSQKPPERVVEVRYLPAPAKRCLMQAPPQEPEPPDCLHSKTQGCSDDQENEYLAALLDDQVRVRRWAMSWWNVCGSSGTVSP